jgi:hypothetical protein
MLLTRTTVPWIDTHLPIDMHHTRSQRIHKGSRDYTTYSIVEYMKLDNEKRLVVGSQDANNNYVKILL